MSAPLLTRLEAGGGAERVGVWEDGRFTGLAAAEKNAAWIFACLQMGSLSFDARGQTRRRPGPAAAFVRMLGFISEVRVLSIRWMDVAGDFFSFGSTGSSPIRDAEIRSARRKRRLGLAALLCEALVARAGSVSWWAVVVESSRKFFALREVPDGGCHRRFDEAPGPGTHFQLFLVLVAGLKPKGHRGAARVGELVPEAPGCCQPDIGERGTLCRYRTARRSE